MFKIVLDWYISISIIIHRTLHVCLWIRIYLLVIKKKKNLLQKRNKYATTVMQYPYPRLKPQNNIPQFGHMPIWAKYRSAVAKNYVPRKNLAQGGRTYFKPKFVINLPGLIKWPLVGKVWLQLITSIWKKCIKEDITITLKFQVYSLLERYGEGIDKSL